ncbi:MAG: LutB/LldF family L-lactate oxidation iron-sulfur protein [bacterium]
MKVSPLHTKRHIKDALGNASVRKAVMNATDSTKVSRQKIVDQIPYWEILRSKAHSIKKDVIENLDKYLLQFEENCAQNGITVHWASDAAEARKIILDIAQKNKVKKIVKSKSLTTEEIHLNDFLIENGIEALETDLGEYIVQLNEQIPSHLIIPAMHLSRKDIGKLFADKLGVDYTEEPVELLEIARKILREKFLYADMGITGVNFAFASSGSFCIVENEANAHNTLSLPRIHVAVMGLEKIIPDVKYLPYFLKLLPPSATGQKSSTYVNFVGGPSRTKYGEGPEQVHIVILDNGRTKVLRNPKLRETLFCIRCGACLNICPVYQQIGGHAYGWVYMGPIGATLIPQYLGEKEGKLSPFLSSLCGACYDVCPVKINLPDHLLTLRNKIVESGNSKAAEKAGFKLWSFFASRPRLYRFASWIPAKLQQLFPSEKAFPVPGYYKKRKFARFDKNGFRKQFLEMKNKLK